MTAQVAADLRAAAEVLERDGWTQGAFTDPKTGAHCAVGGIMCATGDEVGSRTIAARSFFHRHLGSRNATDWNDDLGRTAAEVIAALRAAAARAEASVQ